MNAIVSNELFQHILSFRPTHPVGQLIKNAYDIEMKKFENDDMDRGELINDGTFVELCNIYGEDYGVFKMTLWGIQNDSDDEEEISKINVNIIEDYNSIYKSYGVEEFL